MNIETKHIVWIFDAAGQHFQKQLREQEQELATLQALYPNTCEYEANQEYPRFSPVKKTVGERTLELQQWIHQNKELMKFCQESKNRAVDVSAQEFAKQFNKERK